MSFLYRWTHLCIYLVAFLGAMILPGQAGWIENRDGKTIIHLKLYSLPDPTRIDTKSRADYAVVQRFVERFPEIFKERYAETYKADPETYGDYNWDDVELELHKFSGISIEGQGMDSGPLMAIAGGVSPDIIYVNFRQSDTYIQQGFLLPLDEYIDAMDPEEREFQIHPKTLPVIRRKGPDGEVHYWAKPTGGLLGKVMLYRKDLLDAHDIAYPGNDWTWDDLYWACRKLTDPASGRYGIRLGKGKSESFFWVTFLWSAGGEALVYNEEEDLWSAAFDDRAAAQAVDYYTVLNSEIWYDNQGRRRYGYAAMEVDELRKWDLGQIGFMTSYIDEKLFATINPDLVGMVPVPIGPGGNRGAELNSRMQGIFSGVESPIIRDTAWEYLRYIDSREAVQIRTQIMVEGGLGRFVNPRYLRMFGYDDLIRLAPKGWVEIFEIAIETGKPEPYGSNSQRVYEFMTDPLVDARAAMRDGNIPTADPDAIEAVSRQLMELVSNDDAPEALNEPLEQVKFALDKGVNTASLRLALRQLNELSDETGEAEIIAVRDALEAALDEMQNQRLDLIQGRLETQVKVVNEKMIGVLTPRQKLIRRSVAAVMLIAIVIAFALVLRKIFRAFTPPELEHNENKEKWGFRKYGVAYIIILPAVLSILVWQYIPLIIGSAMAFQDYQIVGDSTWVGIDNFANILWDVAWWQSVWNALRYSILVITLTFLPPVILAVLLDEIPQGKIFFRTIFYLPAVITGLVVIYLWRSFYEGNEYGALNRVVMAIPALGYVLLALFFFGIMVAFAQRLCIHQSYWQSHLCNLLALGMFIFIYRFADTILVDSDVDPRLLMSVTLSGLGIWFWNALLSQQYRFKDYVLYGIATAAIMVLLTINAEELKILIAKLVTFNYGDLVGANAAIDWRDFFLEGRLDHLTVGLVVLSVVLALLVRYRVLPAAGIGSSLAGAGVLCLFPVLVLLTLGFNDLQTFFNTHLMMTQPEPYRWLDDEATAMLCCVLPMVWAGMGPGCLIYLAALKGIAPDFYEAADIDGATFIDKILFIVIPILKPLLVINFVGVFIGAWKSSAFILAMTGGASNTEVAGLHIFYKAYLHLKFGPAAAMAWILGFMLIGFTVHQLRILSRLEFKTTGGD